MLTSAELDQLRRDVRELLPDTAQIQRPTTTVDAWGGVVETWATTSTASCRLDPITRQDMLGQIAGMEAGRMYYRLTLGWDADLRDGDRVLISGEVLEVLQVTANHSARVSTRAIAVKRG